MSNQVMQMALDALKRVEMVDDDCNILASNLSDAVVAAIEELRAEIAKPVAPVAFLADATRFKVRCDEDSEACRIYGIPHELNGRWVALVAADDNCHLKLTTPPDTEAMRRDAELGRVAMRFVDRAGDVHPGIDDAETICADFYKAMCAAIAAQGGGNE